MQSSNIPDTLIAAVCSRLAKVSLCEAYLRVWHTIAKRASLRLVLAYQGILPFCRRNDLNLNVVAEIHFTIMVDVLITAIVAPVLITGKGHTAHSEWVVVLDVSSCIFSSLGSHPVFLL